MENKVEIDFNTLQNLIKIIERYERERQGLFSWEFDDLNRARKIRLIFKLKTNEHKYKTN